MSGALEREFPWCTIILVVLTIVCHTLVFSGNVATARAFNTVGMSSSGWSHVAIDLSDRLVQELDTKMANVTSELTLTIGNIQQVLEAIDLALTLLGNTSLAGEEAALVQLGHGATLAAGVASMPLVLPDELQKLLDGKLELPIDSKEVEKYAEKLKDMIKESVGMLMDYLHVKLQQFMDIIIPPLNQTGQWLLSFSDKVQASIDTFSTTVDRVQKIFDQLMKELSGGDPAGDELMRYDTFTLFSATEEGKITAEDLSKTAETYGISVLEGKKAQQLFNKYDEDNNGYLNKKEYKHLVRDPTIPGVMSVVLRTYSKRMTEIAGTVLRARMRDEVADATVQFFTLVSAKNLTKVQWVAETLTNRSVPIEFTTTILKQLAQNVDNPNVLTDKDIGQIVITEMVVLDADYVTKCLNLMGTPEWWDSEGFDPQDQPVFVERATKWVTEAHGALNGEKASESLLSLYSAASRSKHPAANLSLLSMPLAARQVVARRQQAYQARLIQERARKQASLYTTSSSQLLRTRLLGGVSATSRSTDPEVQRALRSGQPAAPETLVFAKYLSWNASLQAEIFLDQCFAYSGDSSGALDSIANMISGMAKKMTNFLTQMQVHATPKGQQRLMSMVEGFTANVENDIVHIMNSYVDKLVAYASKAADKAGDQVEKAQDKVEKAKDMRKEAALLAESEVETDAVTDKMESVVTVLAELQVQLPAIVQNLKMCRQEVSKVATSVSAVFGVLEVKGPVVFETISKIYRQLWTTYFVLFVVLTSAVLIYGFWASGWFGGPQGQTHDNYEPPRSFMDRIRVCCDGCSVCLKNCHDNATCFWSFVLVMEVVVLLLFIIAILLTVISGAKAFLVAGCAQVYIVNDPTICTGALSGLQTFLTTFWNTAGKNVVNVCDEETLLTCNVLGQQLKNATMFTIVGSMGAAVFSFQLIVESAVLHERSRWRRMFDAELNKP